MSIHMTLLLVVMAITAIYSNSHKTRRGKKNCVIVITIILALFSGLRTWWMGDLIKYYSLYCNCIGPEWRTFLFSEDGNVGIRWLFRYGNMIGISFDNCLLLIAVFVAVTLGVMVYRYSPSPYWSYLIYIAMGFYLFTYSGLKQTIAMGFLVLAAMAIFEKKPCQFVIWVLAGSWFHVPALIFLVAYPFCRQRLNGWYFAVLALLFGALFLFRNQIVSFLSLVYYDDENAYAAVDSTKVGGRFIMMVLIMIAGLIMRPLHSWDKIYMQVFNLMVLAAALQTMSVFDNNFTRLTDYYYQFVVLFIPLMLQSGHSQARLYPRWRREIRYWSANTYVLAGVGITLFALWFYRGYIDSSWVVLKDYMFRWEIDPYALYGQ